MKAQHNVVDSLLAIAGLAAKEVKTELKTRVLLIGPEEAKALLVANTDNRKLRKGRVNYYARAMLNGEWHLTHQGIAFSSSGNGIDLQHRLCAVIESGVTIPIMVTEGLSEHAFSAIDQHERRTAGDALNKDRSIVEEAKFFIYLVGGANSTNPTIAQIGEMCAEIESASQYLSSVCGARRKLLSSAPLRCSAITLMIESPKIKDIAAKTYRDMVLRQTESWTPAMHAFGRQIDSGKISLRNHTDRCDLFTRGLVVLDPTKTNVSKIQISEEGIIKAKQRAADLFGSTAYDQEQAA